MHTIDLDEAHLPPYLCCLEEWSSEMAEAGDHKARWYARMKERGLRVKLAVDDDGAVAGMIHYLPIEESFIQGTGLYHVLCVWVHGYAEGVGRRQGHGLGALLLHDAEEDARRLGANGMSAWGLTIPVWMRARWYRRHGYRPAERDGISLLVWKPFTPAAQAPRWIHPVRRPARVPGQVTVTAFINGWCPAQAITYERARRAAAEIGAPVVFEGIDTSDRETFLVWGISDGLYIDGRGANIGPPQSYEQLRARLLRAAQRLR
ncbi:MAG: GNAT family N-acetyltransferase [Anaerolineae bacterium]